MEFEDLELVRSQPAIGKPSEKPPFFDERYVLPEHRTKLLQMKNPHELDNYLTFYEEPHIYTFHGKPVEVSVSSLVHPYEDEFNPGIAISLMKKSKKESWPRLKYTKNHRIVKKEELVHTNGCILYDSKEGVTISSISPSATTLNGTELYNMLQNQKISIMAESEELYMYEREYTTMEIKELWEKNGEDARNRGTEAHLQMELFFNSEPCRFTDEEVVHGVSFIRNTLIPIQASGFRTEWEIIAEEEDVAGSIDLATILPSGEILLVDWKRSDKLDKKMRGFKKMKNEFSHLPDCAGVAYAIQLSTYQYIIEKYYNLKVVGRVLACIHPNCGFTTAVPYLKDEVEYLMTKRRKRVIAKKIIAQRHPELCCCITGDLAIDAVKDEENRLYSKKAALLQENIQVKEDPDTSLVIENFISSEITPTPFKGVKGIWESLVPIGGVSNPLAFA